MDKTFVQFTKDHFFIQNFLEQAAGNVSFVKMGRTESHSCILAAPMRCL